MSFSAVTSALASHPRPVVLAAIRTALDSLRGRSLNGRLAEPLTEQELCAQVMAELERSTAPSLHPVVNGTGVVIHTNLGRSLLSASSCRQLLAVAERYSNLEMDIGTGERGERYSHVESLLCELTGAEAGIVVNNNAAAVLLALAAMAPGKEIIVSRGELVEIGGSFRIPEVMRISGGTIREVGTTNRTHLKDYADAITAQTGLLLKVHTSNFAVVGFKAEVTLDQMVCLGKEKGIPVMADIGSGSLLDLSGYGITGETPVREYLKSGVDIVTCSGDKMLGGPQAGILLGTREAIARLRKDQLLRALRIDKLTLAALEATLRHYRDEREALAEIPTLRMLTVQPDELKKKALSYIRRIRPKIPATVRLKVMKGSSQVGGGSLPLLDIPSFLITVEAEGWSPRQIDETFRQGRVPVLGRISKGQYLLDLRTLQDADIPALIDAMKMLGQYF